MNVCSLLSGMRVAGFCAALLMAAPCLAGGPHDWAELGLKAIEPVSDSEGELIRGASASTSASGLSLLAAALLDPNTGSNVQSFTASHQSSSHQGMGSSQQQQLSEFGFGLEVSSSLGTFSAQAAGIAGGFSLSAVAP